VGKNMVEILEPLILILRLAIIVAPVYVSNAFALLLGGKTALDFGKNFFDGKPIFGKGKTFKGTVFGILTAIFVAMVIAFVFPKSVNVFYGDEYLPIAFTLIILAVFGDIIGSFIKRRIGIERGKQFFLLDQLDFVLLPLIYAYFTSIITLIEVIIVLIITPIVHRIANFVAFKFKLKTVPW
jgi:CDP-2,3-bis-(O-geranylgeranyl)-sn-glycerol synthase